jgi:hypothetical protein
MFTDPVQYINNDENKSNENSHLGVTVDDEYSTSSSSYGSNSRQHRSYTSLEVNL